MTSGEDIEALIAGLQRQQISEHAASYGTSTAYTSGASALPGSRARKKLLYVDGLNFTSKHWFKSRSHWDVELAAKNIKEFVEAAERGGWSLMVFVVGCVLHPCARGMEVCLHVTSDVSKWITQCKATACLAAASAGIFARTYKKHGVDMARHGMLLDSEPTSQACHVAVPWDIAMLHPKHTWQHCWQCFVLHCEDQWHACRPRPHVFSSDVHIWYAIDYYIIVCHLSSHHRMPLIMSSSDAPCPP